MSILNWEDGVTPLNDENLSKLEQIGRKGIPDGYVPLDADGKIDPSYLPPTGGDQTLGEFSYNDTVAEPPAAGQLRMDSADQDAATKLWISETTAPGADVAAILATVKAGEAVYLQDKDDATRWQAYTVAADATDEGTYKEITVVFAKGGTALAAGQRVFAVVRRVPGGGGGGGGIEYENAWAAPTAYEAGDVVEHEGVQYLAVNPSTGEEPVLSTPAAAGALPVIPLVTELPATPFDGMEVILTDSLTAPTYTWRLRYVAAKATNKWVFIGGSPVIAEVLASQTTNSQTYAALATAGPSITLPLAGEYLVTVESLSNSDGADKNVMHSYDVGATAASDDDAAQFSDNFPASVTRTVKKAVVAPTTLTSKYKIPSGGTATFARRSLRATPIAVGG